MDGIWAINTSQAVRVLRICVMNTREKCHLWILLVVLCIVLPGCEQKQPGPGSAAPRPDGMPTAAPRPPAPATNDVVMPKSAPRSPAPGTDLVFMSRGPSESINVFMPKSAPRSPAPGADLGGMSRGPSESVGPSETFPEFPWPPPKGCTRNDLPDEYIRNSTNTTLADVDLALRRALDAADYSEKSYYSIPSGFALVTRLEQIDREGNAKPTPDRWVTDPLQSGRFSLLSYLKALLTSPRGNFRVLVLAVTCETVSTTNRAPTRIEAQAWLEQGANRLPAYVGARKYTSDHRCTGLVYEFETGTAEKAVLRDPPLLSAKTHLEKARLWACLQHP